MYLIHVCMSAHCIDQGHSPPTPGALPTSALMPTDQGNSIHVLGFSAKPAGAQPMHSNCVRIYIRASACAPAEGFFDQLENAPADKAGLVVKGAEDFSARCQAAEKYVHGKITALVSAWEKRCADAANRLLAQVPSYEAYVCEAFKPEEISKELLTDKSWEPLAAEYKALCEAWAVAKDGQGSWFGGGGAGRA